MSSEHEQKITQKTSPYEKVIKLFEKAYEREEDEEGMPFRCLKLKDGTYIEFENTVSKKLFTVEIYLFGKDILFDETPAAGFTMGEDGGLKALLIPEVGIKVGDKKFTTFEGRHVSHLNLDGILSENSKKRELAMGKVMVDWLEGIIRKNKYRNPPITASVFQ